MQTIPTPILDQIVQHCPHLAQLVANVRGAADDMRVAQLEKALATAYLLGDTHLSAQETWYLAQCANGGPWGGDWVSTAHAADLTGYDDSHLRRLAGAGTFSAIKRGKTWYVRRDALPSK